MRMQEEIKRLAERLRVEKGLNLQVAGQCQELGSARALDPDRSESRRIYADRPFNRPGVALQALATPDSIAISEGLRKLVEGYFTLKTPGPARIKGSIEPLNVYVVTGRGPLCTRLQRSAGRGLTRFVGREREMEALMHTAVQAKEGREQTLQRWPSRGSASPSFATAQAPGK